MMNGRKKRVLLALLLAIALVGVVSVARGYPDWSIDVIQHEGTTFVVTGNVDAYITNSQLDVNVTNASLDVNVTNSEIAIKPAESVVFTIQGDVNATVQGTASVSIDNATITIDVATIKERASEENKLGYAWEEADVDANDAEWVTLFTNDLGETVYIEAITCAITKSPRATGPIEPLEGMFMVDVYDQNGNRFAEFYLNGYSSGINFDPAVPLPANGYVRAGFINRGDIPAEFWISLIYRKG